MRFLISAVMLVSALPHALSEMECTSPGVDAIKASGDSLLQTQRHKEVAPVANTAPQRSSPSDKAKSCAQVNETQCRPVIPHGLQKMYDEVSIWSLLSIGDDFDGTSAPLDASGFKEVSSQCCPPEMEVFFIRLLDSRGYKVCSIPHLQGLMHWFSCVPDMDFQYVIDIILNGNPCKYWALSGETCPALSAQCAGTYCGSSGASSTAPAPATPAAPAPATPAAPAPTATAAPAEETTTTEAFVKVDLGMCTTSAECECGKGTQYALPYAGGVNRRCIAEYYLGAQISVTVGFDAEAECGTACDAEATCTSFALEGDNGFCQLCKAGAEPQSANTETTTASWMHYVYSPNLCAVSTS